MQTAVADAKRNLFTLIMSNPASVIQQNAPVSNNQPLIDSVRNWVHFDNLCAMLSRQMSTARNMRNTFEDKILSMLGKTKRLKIQGAYLEPTTRSTSITLSWGTLEESLHKYFAAHNKPDETDAILAYMKENRGKKSTMFLKKVQTVDLPAGNSITE